MSHSAEFLRGAVAALEKTLGFRSGGLPWVVPMSHQERVSVWDNYRISLVLAEAEAREALDKSRGQLCTCQSHQFVQCRGPESLGKGWVCAKQQEQDRKAREAAEARHRQGEYLNYIRNVFEPTERDSPLMVEYLKTEINWITETTALKSKIDAEVVIADYINNNGTTCDGCQHVMIDVTSAKTGEKGHCTAGDTEGDGSGCAWCWSETDEKRQLAIEHAAAVIAQCKAAIANLRPSCRAGNCFCPYSQDIAQFGHFKGCKAANKALAAINKWEAGR